MLRALILALLLPGAASAVEADLRDGIWRISDLTPAFLERYLQLRNTVGLDVETEGLSPFAANRAQEEAREELEAFWSDYQTDNIVIWVEQVPTYVAWDAYQMGSHRFLACLPSQIDIGEWSVLALLAEPMAPRRSPSGLGRDCRTAAQQRGWHNVWYLEAVNLFVNDDAFAERVYEAYANSTLTIRYRCVLMRPQHNGVVCNVSNVEIFDTERDGLGLIYSVNAERYTWY
ncbi:hypothetical protein [Rhodophyticola porphyridii]|uniref:Uncharacterized protein n=1 Tax=Rhodophyticola porphyridii TaxID=1852017 RepID=A0A3L9Y3E3_9RHOB|nr:hypothetical protein [Rhodophyticola porphyridii]RMA43294.1 hypothetical protein D9R08_06690 [Rhodophyticola porphyridii]